jgi:hypothetical protein
MKLYALVALLGAAVTTGVETEQQHNMNEEMVATSQIESGALAEADAGAHSQKIVMASKYLDKAQVVLDALKKEAKSNEKSSSANQIKTLKAEIKERMDAIKELQKIGGGTGPYKRALMDLKGTKHRQSSDHSANWKNPRLDSRTGLHQHGSQPNRPQWWEMTFPKLMQVSKFTYKKRADYDHQFPTAVRVQYNDGKKWQWYKKAAWLRTGCTAGGSREKEYNIAMNPTFNAKAIRVHQDRAHNNHPWFSGRYDWWVRPV